MILFDILVDDDGNFCERALVLFGHARKIGIAFQPFDPSEHRRVVILFLPDLKYEFGEVETLDVDSVALQGHLVEAHRLEGRRARADAAEVEAAHAPDHAADRGKIFKIFAERLAQRVHDVRLHHRERDLVLIEHVRHRKLAAEGVAAVREVHLADLVGVCLHEDGHARVLQRRSRAVFVDEDGHAQNDAVVLPFVALQPVVVQPALFARFHRAVAGCVLVHCQILVPRVRHGFDHVLPRARDELCGHEPAVAEIECEFHFINSFNALYSFLYFPYCPA